MAKMETTKDNEAIFSATAIPKLKVGQSFKFTDYCWMKKISDNCFEATVINAVGGIISATRKSKKDCVEWIKETNGEVEKIGRNISC